MSACIDNALQRVWVAAICRGGVAQCVGQKRAQCDHVDGRFASLGDPLFHLDTRTERGV